MTNEMPDVAYSNYGSAQALNLNQHMNLLAQNHFNQQAHLAAQSPQQIAQPKEPDMALPARRLVHIFIIDPHESVPLDQCLLYRGDLKLTDCTDQELFYEIDIKTLLDRHNDKRRKIIDKKVKDRTEYLEPARIRDLRMQIVEVAKF